MLSSTPRTPFTLAVSLKMYFGHSQSVEWAHAVGAIAAAHPAVLDGVVELFVIPSFPALVPVRDALGLSRVRLGAQDVHWHDQGAFTGEVSPLELTEVGCSIVELGHAERRRLFGETDATVALKTVAVLRNGMTPLICVGEDTGTDGQVPTVSEAAATVVAQLSASLERADSVAGPVIVAYEPVWAIGASVAASTSHIVDVVQALEIYLDTLPLRAGSRVIYGGSAAPGLLSKLGGRVRGLFLGRFAHDPSAVGTILDEALALSVGERA